MGGGTLSADTLKQKQSPKLCIFKGCSPNSNVRELSQVCKRDDTALNLAAICLQALARHDVSVSKAAEFCSVN